jgi:hypothetical protein
VRKQPVRPRGSVCGILCFKHVVDLIYEGWPDPTMYLSGLLATPMQVGATAPSPRYHTGDVPKHKQIVAQEGIEAPQRCVGGGCG